MKNVVFIIAVVSMGIAVTLAAMAFYPFFEIGYTSIANEYPNSKAYVVAASVNDSGNPEEFYILGMDFTTNNVILVNIPANLAIDGAELSGIYSGKGISGVGSELSKTIKIGFTDEFVMKPSGLDEFIKAVGRAVPVTKISRFAGTQETSGEESKLENMMREIKTLGIIGTIGLYPDFSKMFDSTVTLPKFIRIAKFIDSSPKLSAVSFPVSISGGSVTADGNGLKNLSIELENCSPIHNPLSIKVEVLNNSGMSQLGFSYTTWNLWSKIGYDFGMIPFSNFTDEKGGNIVIDLSNSQWKKDAIQKTLESFYPDKKFDFTSTASPDVLNLYYEIINGAASKRYYNVGNADFIILLGS